MAAYAAISSFASWSLTSVRRGKQSTYVPSAYRASLAEVMRSRKQKLEEQGLQKWAVAALALSDWGHKADVQRSCARLATKEP
jgi:hypothetical protein